MNVAEAIRMKRAVREFAAQPLDAGAVRAILHAGRRAQSAKNSQPWHFIAVQDRAALAELSQTGTFAHHLASASLAVFVLTPDPAQHRSILFDVGQAAALGPVPEDDDTLRSTGIGSSPMPAQVPLSTDWRLRL